LGHEVAGANKDRAIMRCVGVGCPAEDISYKVSYKGRPLLFRPDRLLLRVGPPWCSADDLKLVRVFGGPVP